MPIFYLDSGSIDNLEISSSLLVSGTLVVSGSLQTSGGGLTGSLFGTASFANTASLATTASYYELVTGTSGTNFNIATSPSGSVLNIPDASATARGLVTTGTQTIAGFKTFTSPLTITDSGGNLTIPAPQGNFSLTSNKFTGIFGANSTSGRVAIGAGTSIASVSTPGTFNYFGLIIAGDGAFSSNPAISASLVAQLAVRPVTGAVALATFTTNSATVYIEGAAPITNVINNYALWVDGGSTRLDGNLIMSQSNIIVTGSVNASSGFTGSLFGTASYVTGSVFTSVNPALSASYALSSSFAVSASWAPGGGGTPGGNPNELQYNNAGTFDGVPVATYDGTTLRVTGSFTGSLIGQLIGTASWAGNSVTASYITTAQSASYVTGSVFSSTNPALSASYALSSSFSSTAVTASFTLSGGTTFLLSSTGISIADPTAAEDVTLLYTSGSVVIKAVEGVVRGSAVPSVTVTLRYDSDRNATGTAIVSAQAVTSTTTGNNLTLTANTTVPAGNFVWLETTAQSGTVNELFIGLVY